MTKLKPENIWPSVLTELRLSLSKTIYQTLFAETELKEYKNKIAKISCPNPYLADLIEKRYYSLLKAALDKQVGEDASLVFVIDKSKKTSSKPENDGPLFQKKERETLVKPSYKNIQNLNQSGLKQSFSFENFVVGDTNHLAFAAAQGIIKNPGNIYNPLFIWGGVGVGKTHLMHAIGNELLKTNPDWKILYVSAETFGSELISALKENRMSKFKNKYRRLDAFLIDDIQFIAGKEYTQDEFFHTFNSLYLAGKQIILTSDRKPEEVQPLEDRLTSRFMGGLTVDVQAPDFEMRIAILKQKSEQRKIGLSEKAIAFIAETIESNARELEGTLIQVAAQAQMQNQEIDLGFVKNFFGVKKNGSNQKKVSYRQVISTVAKYHQVKTSDIKGSSRKKGIATARHISAYLLRKELEMPLQRIGQILGGRDHTTIMHSEEKVDRLFSTNQQIRHDILEIRKQLYS